MDVFLAALGWVLMIGGIVLEAVGTVAMTSHRVRQRLPTASPFSLFGIGGAAFVVGAILLAIGR